MSITHNFKYIYNSSPKVSHRIRFVIILRDSHKFRKQKICKAISESRRSLGCELGPLFLHIYHELAILLELCRRFWKGGGRLAVVRPPRWVAGHGSHDATALCAPFKLGLQVALAFAAANLFLLLFHLLFIEFSQCS